VTRVRSGFDIGQLIHEFAVLRGVIRGVARERGEESLGVEALLADVLDAAVGEAVKAYVEARDYEARRTQAENIAFLTHELRNPLSSAMLAAAGLRQRASGVDAQLAALERSHRRLEELIDGVLESERLEADRAPSHPVDMALGEVLAPALEAARSEAQRKQLEFRTQYDPGLRVWVDPALTRSAVQNLVDNGVKYTDAGHVELSVHDGPRELSIHVRDTCHGLSPEELRTIFEPFRRGRTKKHGTGLGLSIARRAIERQGGSLHAESPEPVGCHFWIELPKRKQG
jgi:signal transduction histidine kinase